MKISLEGTQQEVMGLIHRMAGGIADNAAVAGGLPDAAGAEPSLPAGFDKLVRDWAEGFDLDGTAHWDSSAPSTDKADMLHGFAISRPAGAALVWVSHQGGLTRAVHSILGGDPVVSRAIAVNMTQVSSILFPDLADLLEHFDPFEDNCDG